MSLWICDRWSMFLSLTAWDVSNGLGTDDAECCRKVSSWWKIASEIQSPMKAKSLRHEFSRVAHESLLLPVLFMEERQWYGERRKYLRLELYRCTAVGMFCV